MTSQWPVSCRLFSIPPVIWHHVTLIDSNAYRFPNFRISLSNSAEFGPTFIFVFLVRIQPGPGTDTFFTICVRSEHIKCFMVRAVHSADPVRESLTSSVRDDFDIRDYSRQDLFFETGYESELITTINLINSEKGGSKIYFWIKLIFDQIKKASEWKINFTEKTPDFIFWKSKTPEYRTR